MEILYNNNLINQIVDQLFKHKRTDYSEFGLQNILCFAEIEHEVHRVVNQNYEKLYTSLFRKSQKPEVCIVFMHGYGSNRLQCSNILKVLPDNYALCSFDFSGSGKSEGDLVTYGMKEKQDINSIIKYLRQREFKKFILWGRSMGATSALLYCLKYNPQDVLLQVIDSPFYSFQMIASEIANKNVKAPQFVISFALQMAKKNCNKFEYNPFEIELNDIGQCKVPALFIYSQGDSVINFQNTQLICARYKAIFQKLVIDENHNTIRTQSTLDKIFEFIQKYSKKPKLRPITSNYIDCKSSNEGTPTKYVSLKGCRSSIDESSDKSYLRKGIERVNIENKSKKFDDYGIWVASRFKQEVISTPQSSSINKRGCSAQKPHLSLSSSLASKKFKNIESALSPSCLNSDFSKETSSSYFLSGISKASQKKSGSKKKISTVKSFSSNLYLSNSKYL